MTIQPVDKKILVAGLSWNNSAGRYDFALARYNPDGTPDTSFDGDGKVTTSLSQYDKGFSVVVQGDGKILVAGSAQWDATWGIALVRYNTDGSLDTSFGDKGKVTTKIYDNTWKYAYGNDMTVQSDGKILVSGSIIRNTNTDGYNTSDIVVVRYNKDGSLDTDFGKINSLDAININVYTKYGLPVVLDRDVQIYDAALALSGNYSGATLTLSRHVGADSNDLFSAKHFGSLGALIEGGNLTIGGTAIGVINTNSEGLLKITFNDHATQSLVNSVLQQIAYSNNIEDSTATVQMDWTFSEGNTSNQGTGEVLSVTGNTFMEFNNAPTGNVVITGSAVQGSVLTASNTLEDLDGIHTAPTYVWKADGVTISGATYSTISLTRNEVGKHITVVAGYWDNLMNYETVSSLQTVPVNPGGTTSPTVLTISSAEGTSKFDVSSNIVLKFNEAITLGTGTIALHRGSVNGTVVESYDVATSGNLSIAENVLTINPTADLADSTHYYVTLDAGSVNNLAGNHFAGSAYDFTTNGPIVEIETLFVDDFNRPLNSDIWGYPVGNASFYGRTQQRTGLPLVSDGELHLKLDTYNPSNGSEPSFYGSEAITKQTFSNYTGGIVFEFKAHFVNSVAGIVGGMFSYANNPGNLHDEIDFEAVSNKPGQIQTNIYANEPLGAGHPQFNPIEGVVTQDHLYRIEWFKNAIRWIVDGQLVRVETDYISQNAMPLHLNIWAPGKEWVEAYSGALNPVTTAGANTSYLFDIDYVRVARLSSTYYYPDSFAPDLISANPVDGATGVAVGNDIVLTFSEAIQKGTGAIEIHSGSAVGTLVAHYDVATSSDLTIAGNMLTINPASDLAHGSHYFVTFDEGSVKDMAGNTFAGTTMYDFMTEGVPPELHNLNGEVTFWKTGIPITDVESSTFNSDTGFAHTLELRTQIIEFRNIQVATDGSRTIEIWETPGKSINSLQLAFTFSPGSVATWQDATGLPSGWISVINTEKPGQFILGGMGTTALPVQSVMLGTLTLTQPTNPDRFDLLLSAGWLGDDTVPGIGIASDSMITGADGLYQHLGMSDGTYALTSTKVSGIAEGNAVKANDALAVLKMAVGINPNADGSPVSPYQYLAADVNHDGQVKAADALNILKMAVHLNTAPANEWLFVPESVGNKSMSRTHVVWPDYPIPVLLDADQELDLIGIVKGDVDGSWMA
ncbi:MAG: Ig-like domain-containing protein [Chlorobium sp.]